MKTIPLTQGYFTKVDDEDYERLAVLRWCVAIDPRWPKYVRVMRREKKTLKTIYLSREIMNAPKDKYVDHINGDPLDNRRSNLRLCIPDENLRNVAIKKNNTSGYKGVYPNGGRGKPWVAQIGIGHKKFRIGVFNTKKEAALAYNKAAKDKFGKFAWLNKVTPLLAKRS